MKAGITREFIRQLPKTDLHVHLDGSLRLSTLIELARAARVPLPSRTEEGLCHKVFKKTYADLADYLRGFAYTCAVLQTAEKLERVAYELALDNLAEGVRYIEVRFAPQLHCHDRLTIEASVRAVCRGLARAQRAHNRRPDVPHGPDLPFHCGVILCALRSFNEAMSPYYAQLLRVMAYAPRKQVFATASLEVARAAVDLARRGGLPVVGFDLAGEEAGYPAVRHAAAYQFAHSHFIRKTVHAGEAYGPESIFQAITECHANRIGHGTFLFAADMLRDPTVGDPRAYVRHLVEYIGSQRIGLEVCLTSNLQTTPALSLSNHPLRQMLAHNLSVSINTDNRLVSHTTVCRELELAATHFAITRHQFRNLIIAGFKGSFFPGSYNAKRAYVRRVINRYEELERRLLPPARRA
ncbi:MAG: adenosine deaminase family protein [Kiritimatiellaeota bacterium]|nr:adenosine deaminase family protein [Kiritimatiellota bacterium]